MASPSFAAEQAEQETERIAHQIMRAFQRAARAADRSSRSMGRGGGGGRGGGRMPVSGRVRRAPSSASQFHLHVKKSKASGVGKAPVSCKSKVLYDLGLGENDPHQDRVKIAFVSAPPGTPAPARDPIKMAEACFDRARQSKFANSNTGQMLHLDAALPNSLSPDRLARLSGDINEKISQQFGVPAFSGAHLDHGNFHIHASVPLYEVLDDGEGGFTLGDRIDHAKRPAEREAMGLPRSPVGELRQLRQDIANLIADAVAEEYPNAPHMAERWRHGHLTLSQQVERAALRGDVEFVLDNLSRDATKKEGPRPQKAGFAISDPKRESVEAYNAEAGKSSTTLGPELITRTLVNRVVDLAQKAQIDTPEGFRMLARDHGLSVHWSTAKGGEGVQGVVFSVKDGPRIAGRRLGASLGVLQKKLEWAKRPEYRRFAPPKGDEYDDYIRKVEAAGIRPSDAGEQAIRITLQRLEKLEKQAQDEAIEAKPQAAPAATPVESGPSGPHEVKPSRQRPKRKSNDPAFNKKPTTQAAPAGRTPASGPVSPAKTVPVQEKLSMNVDELMQELQSIPPAPPPVLIWMPKQPANDDAKHPPAVGAVHVQAPRIPSSAELTTRQREILALHWDAAQARKMGTFDGPIAQIRERMGSLREGLRMMSKNEPSPSEVPRKRLFRSTTMVETDDHRKWRESIQAGHKKIDALEKQVNEMINKAIADTALRAALPALEAVADRTEAQQRRAAKVQAVKLYENAVEQLGTTRPGSYQAQQAWTIIKQAIESDPVLKRREQQRRAEAAALERQRHGNPAHVQRERQR